ncbi:NEQ043 [Nanoarchaeum equitans Kin4-M]|uniref:NEQ043 n=1 Tax=Nanoarchaeum equitans (strain Kin4-M) TaxID=228908 RepID=Q74N49_NANEQ|nr:NEQ043 [Nanoarchaeum equitans Kin4-M]
MVLFERVRSTKTVRCYYCGRILPKEKAYVIYTKPNVAGELSENEVIAVFSQKRKIYVCPSCARHRGIKDHRKEVNVNKLYKLVF